MTAVSPQVYPGSRTLAVWWKQLAPLQPRALWVGHLLLHRVEALAFLHSLLHVDPISLFVLKALALTGRASLPNLDQRLHLGRPLVRQLLGHLANDQLVLPEEDGTWSLTALGRKGLEEGRYVRACSERRAFYFVDNEQPARPPHFLSISDQSAALAWPAIDGRRFDAGHLQTCVDRPAEWKQRFGFPLEVEKILGSEPAPEKKGLSPFPAWQRVILDCPERLMAVLVLAPAGERQRLLGFAVHLEGWALQTAEPAFAIEADWHEVFPELASDLSLEQWRHAWRTWCQPRGLPAAEMEACGLERHTYRLRVTAPPRLVERLRAARSDVFKGEAWLLAGTGRLRTAAQVELVERKRERVAPTTSRNV